MTSISKLSAVGQSAPQYDALGAGVCATGSSSGQVNLITPACCRLSHTVKVLSNGLKLIGVQDPACKTPAAAMTIATGTYHDPPEFPGLAHFCEHMLFMGSKRYPVEDYYHSLVSENGGHTNAWTADITTTFYFTVGLHAFKRVLEVFVDFFVAPTFSASAVSREVNAVHSEDEKNHMNDHWRWDELMRSLARDEHPRHSYGNGNLVTLQEEPLKRGLDIREALLGFFEKNYVAEGCALAVLSPCPPEELFDLVTPLLEQMKTGPLPPRSFPLSLIENKDAPQPISSILRSSAQGQWYVIKNISKLRVLHLYWEMPFGISSYRTAAGHLPAYVLTHECRGSVIDTLRRRGLATDLVGGYSFAGGDANHGHLSIKITLTDAGMNDLTTVLAILYSCIGLLRRTFSDINSATVRTLNDAWKRESELYFAFYEVGASEDHCSMLTSNAVTLAPEHAFSGLSLVYEDDLKAQARACELLTPERCLVFLGVGAEEDLDKSTSGFCGDKDLTKNLTRFHKCPYSVTAIPESLITRLHAAEQEDFGVQLPSLSPYLTDDYRVRPSGVTNKPESFKLSYGILYTKMNEESLQTPKTCATVKLICPDVCSGAADALYQSLLVQIVTEAEQEYSYFAELAGISSSITSLPSGLSIDGDGPSATTPRYLLDTLKRLLHREFMLQTPEKFLIHKERLLRALRGMREAQPIHLAGGIAKRALRHELFYDWEDILDYIEAQPSDAAAWKAIYSSTYADFVSRMLKSARLEVYINGNLESTTEGKTLAEQITTVIEDSGIRCADPKSIVPFRDVYTLPLRRHCQLLRHAPYSHANVNAAAHLLIHIVPPSGSEFCDGHPSHTLSPEAALLVSCISSLISAPFFSALRSREALGYITHAAGFTHASAVQGSVAFNVQSAVAPPMYLYSRIVAFLDAFETQFLVALTEKKLNDVLLALAERLSKPATTVAADHHKIMTRTRNLRSGASFIDEQLRVLESGKITVDVVRRFFAEFISNNAAERRALLVIIDSDALKDDEGSTCTEAPETVGSKQQLLTVQLPAKRDFAPAETKETQGSEGADSEGASSDDAVASDCTLSLDAFKDVQRNVTFETINGKDELRAMCEIYHVPFM